MTKILVPVDYSKGADNALNFAIEIARKTNAGIMLMHVFDTPVLYPEVPLSAVEMDFSMIYNAALKQLKEYHEKISVAAPEIRFELVLQHGLASSRIIETALEKKVDLVVMCSSGKGAMERLIMGSNTLRVIKKAPCLVLVIPPVAKFEGFSSIVYATDLETDNLKHIKRVLPLANMFDSEILFLNVDATYTTKATEEIIHEAEQRIRKYFPYSNMSVHLSKEISVAKGISQFMKKTKSHCLAVYTRRKNILDSILEPHIAEDLAIHASAPLLVIHKKDHTEF